MAVKRPFKGSVQFTSVEKMASTHWVKSPKDTLHPFSQTVSPMLCPCSNPSAGLIDVGPFSSFQGSRSSCTFSVYFTPLPASDYAMSSGPSHTGGDSRHGGKRRRHATAQAERQIHATNVCPRIHGSSALAVPYVAKPRHA